MRSYTAQLFFIYRMHRHQINCSSYIVFSAEKSGDGEDES
ncbi:hypothetical protein DSUL_40086 [Desulfovibrionales bacterium]